MPLTSREMIRGGVTPAVRLRLVAPISVGPPAGEQRASSPALSVPMRGAAANALTEPGSRHGEWYPNARSYSSFSFHAGTLLAPIAERQIDGLGGRNVSTWFPANQCLRPPAVPCGVMGGTRRRQWAVSRAAAQ